MIDWVPFNQGESVSRGTSLSLSSSVYANSLSLSALFARAEGCSPQLHRMVRHSILSLSLSIPSVPNFLSKIQKLESSKINNEKKYFKIFTRRLRRPGETAAPQPWQLLKINYGLDCYCCLHNTLYRFTLVTNSLPSSTREKHPESWIRDVVRGMKNLNVESREDDLKHDHRGRKTVRTGL